MTEHDPRYDFSDPAPVYWTAAHAINMELRDHFAAMAMKGLMDAAMPMPEIAQAAYEMADAMMEARKS